MCARGDAQPEVSSSLSSSSSFFALRESFFGTATWTTTIRSPRLLRLSSGMPLPRTTTVSPGCTPAGTLTFDRFVVEAGHVDLGAERGLGEADLEAVHQVGALALEARVRLDGHVDVEVPGRPALRAGEPLARDAQRLAVVDAGRERDLHRAIDLDPAAAAAVLAGILDRAAHALAGGARGLQQERPARVRDLARALAARADACAGRSRRPSRRRSGTGPGCVRGISRFTPNAASLSVSLTTVRRSDAALRAAAAAAPPNGPPPKKSLKMSLNWLKMSWMSLKP